MVEDSAIIEAVSALVGKDVAALQRIYAGRNSRVYRAECRDGSVCAVKRYEAVSGAKRLEAEFSALRFMRAHGICGAPEAIAMNSAQCLGVYEWVEGTACTSVGAADIDAAVDFLLELDSLAGSAPDGWHARAAEAFFSLREVVGNINVRLSRLKNAGKAGPLGEELQTFLRGCFEPLFASVVSWGETRLRREGVSMEDVLPASSRTLSASDFGFHNAVRKADSSLVFVDFEYFGWDDPAKMLSDFVLHPAMEVSDELKRRFVGRLYDSLRGRALLVKRLPVAYALFGVKWSLILLNEFVPEDLERRVFAGDSRVREEILAVQLAKAEQVLARVSDTYEVFPYGA